jgi:hypothetical protein
LSEEEGQCRSLVTVLWFGENNGEKKMTNSRCLLTCNIIVCGEKQFDLWRWGKIVGRYLRVGVDSAEASIEDLLLRVKNRLWLVVRLRMDWHFSSADIRFAPVFLFLFLVRYCPKTE